MDQIKEMIISQVIDAGVKWVLGLLSPVGAFVKAVMAIVDIVKTLIERAAQIGDFVNSVIDAVASIAKGDVSGAAKMVEGALAKSIPLIIGFLASLIGVSGIAKKVQAVIQKIRQKIDKAIEGLILKIKKSKIFQTISKKLKKLVKKAKAVVKKVKQRVKAFVKKVKKKISVFGKKAKSKVKTLKDTIIEWWKQKKVFKDKGGEKHTLFFQGNKEQSILMIASITSPVETYLSSYPDQDTNEWKAAQSAFQGAKTVIFTPAKGTKAEQKKKENIIKKELLKMSQSFAKLAGENPKGDDYPKTTIPQYSGLPAKKNSVEYIVGSAKRGTSPGRGKNTGTPGWAEVFEAGLTKRSDKWVQMHVVSEQLGGQGKAENLISAPNSVNTGFFRSFEHSVAKLSKSSNKNIKNVVWLEVSVDYYDKDFASAIHGKAGLYFWKGKNSPQKWMKNEVSSLSASAKIPKPNLHMENKVSLNLSSGTDLKKVTTDKKFIDIIKTNRYYLTKDDFIDKVTEASKKKALAGYAQKIKSVLDNPKIVLNNVE